MIWGDVAKIIIGALGIFGSIGSIIFLLLRYSDDRKKEQSERDLRHAKELEGVKEKNAKEILDRLDRELQQLRNSFSQMEKTFAATLERTVANTEQYKTLVSELKELRVYTEKRVEQVHNKMSEFGRVIIKGDS